MQVFFIQERSRSFNLKPLSKAVDLFLEIKTYNKLSVVLFGHQPFLIEFINYCVSKDQTIQTPLGRGEMMCLNFSSAFQAHSATIEALAFLKEIEI